MKYIAERFWCAVCGKWVKPMILKDQAVCPYCEQPAPNEGA